MSDQGAFAQISYQISTLLSALAINSACNIVKHPLEGAKFGEQGPAKCPQIVRHETLATNDSELVNNDRTEATATFAVDTRQDSRGCDVCTHFVCVYRQGGADETGFSRCKEQEKELTESHRLNPPARFDPIDRTEMENRSMEDALPASRCLVRVFLTPER